MIENGEGHLSAKVLQAQGMVSAQAECSMSEALAMMQNTATATEGTLGEIATLVLSGEVRFD